MTTDSDLQTRVLAELAWQPRIISGHVGVTAKAGVVTLTGHVETYVQKIAAEKAALHVRGVSAVVQEIRVRLSSGISHDDDDIAAAAAERLAWDGRLPNDGIVASVEQGWVTLTGEVGWQYQKQDAERDVHGLSGVIGISNHISLTPRVNAINLEDDIKRALRRSWLFDKEGVMVHVDGGKVTLSGSALSSDERDLAVTTAWSAPGTTDVVNDITIA